MTESRHPNPLPARDDGPADAGGPPEIDVLISRLIDGEAGAVDVERLSRLAAVDPAAWGLLAERRHDQVALEREAAEELRRGAAVTLPGSHESRAPFRWILRAGAASVGWAAALLLTALITFGAFDRPERVRTISHEQAAPHVIESRPGIPLDPILLGVQRLEDGRWLVEWIERRGQRVILDHWDKLWIREMIVGDADRADMIDQSPPDS